MTTPWYRWEGNTLLLSIRVQPRASRSEVVGPLGKLLKIRLAAPPVEGEANRQLIRFLAREFRLPKSRVRLLRGESGRTKSVAVDEPRVVPSWLGAADGNADYA